MRAAVIWTWGVVVLLTARAATADVAIRVHPERVLNVVSPYLTGVCLEDVNHEVYGGLYSQMIHGESFQEDAAADGVSGQWRATGAGGTYAVVTDEPFVGRQSQRVTAETAPAGVENRGLNRWGLHFAGGKPYDGVVWLRTPRATDVTVAAQTADGRPLAEQVIHAAAAGWQRYPFALTPAASADGGRFAVTLGGPGTVDVGYAFLQPGEWGRFAGLPVRGDVVRQMRSAGVTVVRYGGSAVNQREYRWKRMVGPRDRRPPYRGHWHEHTSNGWGIADFLDLCDAAGWLAVPAFCADETPADLADFVEYANAPGTTRWGGQRAADGHPKPYGLRYLEFGNEEQVDAAYVAKFKPVAEAVWARDPTVTIVVGDFEYRAKITDPMKVRGGHVPDLSAHKVILDWARSHGRPVWFDVHIWNERPADADRFLAALPTFADALAGLSPGAEFKVCVFEENANRHDVNRAIAHAKTVSVLQRMGDRVPIVCAANALQADGQNDNGWDQGLFFMNPGQAWMQPSAYATQMLARGYRANRVAVDGEPDGLVVTALADAGGVTVEVTNPTARAVPATVAVDGVIGGVRCTELAGPADAVNTAATPTAVVPVDRTVTVTDGVVRHTFPARSFSVLTMGKGQR